MNTPIPDRVYRLRYGPPTLGACIGALIFFGIWEGISYAIDAIKKASEWRKQTWQNPNKKVEHFIIDDDAEKKRLTYAVNDEDKKSQLLVNW